MRSKIWGEAMMLHREAEKVRELAAYYWLVVICKAGYLNSHHCKYKHGLNIDIVVAG